MPITQEDVLSALINFGSNRSSAEAAVIKARNEAGGATDFETVFRLALKLVLRAKRDGKLEIRRVIGNRDAHG